MCVYPPPLQTCLYTPLQACAPEGEKFRKFQNPKKSVFWPANPSKRAFWPYQPTPNSKAPGEEIGRKVMDGNRKIVENDQKSPFCEASALQNGGFWLPEAADHKQRVELNRVGGLPPEGQNWAKSIIQHPKSVLQHTKETHDTDHFGVITHPKKHEFSF